MGASRSPTKLSVADFLWLNERLGLGSLIWIRICVSGTTKKSRWSEHKFNQHFTKMTTFAQNIRSCENPLWNPSRVSKVKVELKILASSEVTGTAKPWSQPSRRKWLDMDLKLDMQQILASKSTLSSNSEKMNRRRSKPQVDHLYSVRKLGCLPACSLQL